MRSILRDRRTWIWLAVWVSTRALIVAEVGFWATAHPRFEDVNTRDLVAPHRATTPSGG